MEYDPCAHGDSERSGRDMVPSGDKTLGSRLLTGQVSCVLAFSSFTYAVYCVWQTTGSGSDSIAPAVLAKSITARSVLLDIAILSIALFLGLVVTLVETLHSMSHPVTEEDCLEKGERRSREDKRVLSSSLTVSYRLFEMIVAADITIRLLRYLHATYIVPIPMLGFASIVLLMMLPCVAAVIEVSAIVIWFLSYPQKHDFTSRNPFSGALTKTEDVGDGHPINVVSEKTVSLLHKPLIYPDTMNTAREQVPVHGQQGPQSKHASYSL